MAATVVDNLIEEGGESKRRLINWQTSCVFAGIKDRGYSGGLTARMSMAVPPNYTRSQ